MTDLLLSMMWPHWADVLPGSLTGKVLLATWSSQPWLRYQDGLTGRALPGPQEFTQRTAEPSELLP